MAEKTNYTFALLAMVAIVAIVAIVVMFMNKGKDTTYMTTPEVQEAMAFELSVEEMETMLGKMEEENLVGDAYWMRVHCQWLNAIMRYYLHHENPYLRWQHEGYEDAFKEDCEDKWF